jgi:CRISPR-associated protein (TIGR03986 family)
VQNEFVDQAPLGHHIYHAEHWSGWIQVGLKTVTPLLILDAARASKNENDHKTYPVRVDSKGVPYLPPTSVKGMLRAAYETVTNSRLSIFERHNARLAFRMDARTNSRLSIFERHNARLAFRMDARQGVQMVPALVEKGTGGGGLQLRLLMNNNSISDEGTPQGNIMYAAWLPRYRKYASKERYQSDKHESEQALRYPDGALPQHGEPVWVQSQSQQHRSGYFSFYRVTQIRRRSPGEAAPGGSFQAGIVCVTGCNMMNKHDERVFLLNSHDQKLELSPDLVKGWETLVKNYQDIHADDISQRERAHQEPGAYLGHEPGKTGWSRQVFSQDAVELKAGSLCYARIENRYGFKVLGLYPVMISRELFRQSPADLLPSSLHPATVLSALSPADRVFGWLSQNGKGAWRGQLRVEPAECVNGQEAVEYLGEDGFPMAILGEPRPQLARFYAARNPQGEPLLDGEDKALAYQEKQGVRGRKVYPHQAHLANLHGYWVEPREERKPVVHQGRKYSQEYRRPTVKDERGKDKTRDLQNRSIQGWVKPDSQFRFRIYVNNLSSVELGALLWLLQLGDGHFLRLGSGKPLGFGSVHLHVEEMGLRKGTDLAAFYENFLDEAGLSDADGCIDIFKAAIEKAYGKPFEKVSFIKAFRVALQGFKDGLPMHYPRLLEGQHGLESFRWFVENERVRGPHLALPFLEDKRGLPAL